MESEREIFIHGLTDDDGNIIVEGCIRRGVDEKTAISVYDEMESFAHYAFNKSHAAAYANISYKTAWLKCHYPREYMAALLSSVLDNQNKLASYITECKRLGIRVLPPNVNESNLHFTVSGNDIRYGLLAVKNLGRNFIDEIISERINNPYEDFFDFCKRLYGRNMNSRAIESLIKIAVHLTDSEQIADNCSQSVKPFLMMLSTKAEEMRAVRCRFLMTQKLMLNHQSPKFPICPNFPFLNFCIWKTKLRECISAVIRSMNTQLFQKQSMPTKRVI